MKKFFFILIFLLFTSIIFAQQIPKDSIGIYNYQNELMGIMHIGEYMVLIQSAKLYRNELEAEKNKRIKIFVKQNPYIFNLGETFTADVSITWLNEKNEKMKELIFENSLTLKKENLHEIRIMYRDVAEIGFPTLFLLLFLIML